MGNVTDVTDATFDALVVKSDKPVLIDYWADWCAPCRQLSPIIEELAGEYSDKVTFLKMDTNANTAVPTAQGVLSLPTIQIFVGGEVAKQFQGGKTKAALLRAIEEYL
ncbi:MAG: thioredoxin [Propionibacteriaceae bacterium]|nr:thioredoxin [Micropruina sp.]HBY21785.1 thioredoxin [Propionibacteriaceae bacterium]